VRKKLLLINPVNPARTGLTVNRSSRFPPIGLGIIASMTPPSWEVELVDENWEGFSYRKADLVGITGFTASANRSYEIAAVYKEHNTPTVMGGIHASMCTDEALQYVDSVVIGEAESTWPQVIRDAEDGRLQRIYRGKLLNLKELPQPRRDLFNKDYLFASVQTSRGCPMDCEFCTVTSFNGYRYRRRPVNEVLDELSRIPQKMIFFVDDNIIGYGKKSREDALSLFEGMVERKLNKWWFCQASINFADDEEILHRASRAGCKMVFLGLEAEEADALTEINKRLNLKRGTDRYSEIFRRIHRAGIAVLGAFIFGMDRDKPEHLQKRTDYMINSDVDIMQSTFLTPLPGTRLFNRMKAENRLIYNNFPEDWHHYDMTEVVHQPLGMSPDTLSRTTYESNKRMYSWAVILRKAISTLRTTRSPIAAMFSLQSNINYRRVSSSRSAM
jgi:radical SAM superfamily enzyme YgiQ (UPF0313 family)